MRGALEHRIDNFVEHNVSKNPSAVLPPMAEMHLNHLLQRVGYVQQDNGIYVRYSYEDIELFDRHDPFSRSQGYMHIALPDQQSIDAFVRAYHDELRPRTTMNNDRGAASAFGAFLGLVAVAAEVITDTYELKGLPIWAYAVSFGIPLAGMNWLISAVNRREITRQQQQSEQFRERYGDGLPQGAGKIITGLPAVERALIPAEYR